MRILLLAPHPFFQHRGTPIAERALAATLVGLGHELHVLAFPEGEDPHIPGCMIHRTTSIPGVANVRPGFSLKKVLYDLLMLLKAMWLQRRFRFDLVHAVEESAFIALVLKRLYGMPYVYDMDSSLPQQLVDRYPALKVAAGPLEWFEGVVVRHSIAVLAVCRSLEERAMRHSPTGLIGRVEDTSLLPQPGDSTDSGEGAAENLRRAGASDPLVLYIGNLESYQGIDLLLEGFARVGGTAGAARLIIIGGSKQDIERYRSRATALGVNGSVDFLGPRRSEFLAGYLRQADVLVSPRVQGENTPMKIYSYLDSGRPVLATRLPTHTQVLDDDIACLVEPEPTALAAGLERLLRNPGLRTDLAERARDRFLAAFSPAVQRKRLAAFYQAVELRLVGPRARLRTGTESALSITGEP